MKRIYRKGTIFMLCFVAVSAFAGGLPMIADPDGMSIDLLEKSPFDSFLIPGILLVVLIGIGPVVTAWMTLKEARNYDVMIIAQGFILVAWITIEILLIRKNSFLQVVYGGLGALIVLSGIKIKKLKND